MINVANHQLNNFNDFSSFKLIKYSSFIKLFNLNIHIVYIQHQHTVYIRYKTIRDSN